ncbi:MAG: nitrate reductase [Gloeomargaritaceae cyanobacterium C42_A2020_066]|nr:nitrate reductase [Gloeomargaritaceae cyanobacterium C42_A2020_066]
MTSTRSLCPYCGVGCGLEVLPDQGKVRGDRAHPSNQGMVCVKGATVYEALDRDRLLYPQFRETLAQPFRRISWDEALTRLVEQVQTVRETQGPAGLCMYGSGQLQTEDYYVAQKLLKGCLGSNNFDTNSRLCMSSAVAAYTQSFGSDGPPCCYADLDETDCAFLIGTNTAECHPVLFNRLRRHHKAHPQVKLVVVDPRCTPTAAVADLHLAIRPGTDIDLLHGIAHLLLAWESVDRAFLASSTTGFDAFREVVSHYPPETTAGRCGIPVDDLRRAATYWRDSHRVLSLWSMGINQSAEGTAKARSIINLHLLTGQIGKPGAGPFSLTGQPNAMGGREAGGLSHLLPGYRQIANPEHRAEVEQHWGLPAGRISPHPGRHAWAMIEGLEQGEVGLLWIVATNPLVSLPDLNRVQRALGQSPFTVVQDAYFPTETTDFAHLLLPAGQWGEKTGTMTNSERVVTLSQAFRPPPGEARADWEIFAEVGRRLGYLPQFAYPAAAAVFAEFVALTAGRTCDMSGLSHGLLANQGPQPWPYRSIGKRLSGEPQRLYSTGRFPTPDGKARFCTRHSRGLVEPPDPSYPFVLTVGRLYGHWHTQTRTGRIPKLQQMSPKPLLDIHPRDAQTLGIATGDWVEVSSRRGQIRVQAHVTQSTSPGTVFLPMHWGALWAEAAAGNTLTHPVSDPDSHQPELKACAVTIEVLSAAVQSPQCPSRAALRTGDLQESDLPSASVTRRFQGSPVAKHLR